MTRKTSDWHEAYRRGIDFLNSENLLAAADQFSLAIQEMPERWEPYYARGWLLLTSGDNLGVEAEKKYRDRTAMAKADLEHALELGGPYCGDAAALMGGISLNDGDYENAIRYLLQAFGKSLDLQGVEESLVEAVATELERLEEEADPEAAILRCERLESWIKGAGLPSRFGRGLQGEVVESIVLLLARTGRETERQEALRRLGRLVPTHPTFLAESPSAAKGDVQSSSNSRDPTFDDVGGRHVAKSFPWKLCRLFELYFGNEDLEVVRNRLSEYGQKPTRQILLFGPSGCGKTYMIRAFTGEFHKRYGRELPLYVLRLSEVFDKYVGEGEKILSRFITQAMENQPSLLFADEVDAIGGSRDKGQDWRVGHTAHLLQEIDRLREQGAFTLFFGCTNRLAAIDQALIRRFDQMIPVELPGDRVREDILRILLQKLSSRVRPENVDFELLVRESKGLAPGDIEKAVRRCVDDLLSEAGDIDAEPTRLTEGDLLRTIRSYRNPMHLRTWVQDTIAALEVAKHMELAEEVRQLYGPFIEGPLEASKSADGWTPLPEEAWDTDQGRNPGYIRLISR